MHDSHTNIFKLNNLVDECLIFAFFCYLYIKVPIHKTYCSFETFLGRKSYFLFILHPNMLAKRVYDELLYKVFYVPKF